MALKHMQKRSRRQHTSGKDLALLLSSVLTKAMVRYYYGVFRSPIIDHLFKKVPYLRLKTRDGVITNC